MSFGLVIGIFAITTTLVLIVLRAKNSAIGPLVRRMEDDEQMTAVGRGSGTMRSERDPFATLT